MLRAVPLHIRADGVFSLALQSGGVELGNATVLLDEPGDRLHDTKQEGWRVGEGGREQGTTTLKSED